MKERLKTEETARVETEVLPYREEEPRVNIIEVNNLSYQYPTAESPTLSDISFSISEGEVLGIVGDSGSGKSTLLSALSGLIPHFYKEGNYEGGVNFDGQNVKDYSIFKLMQNVGLVFQDPETQSFGMHVDDAIAFGMENIGTPRDEMLERISELKIQLKIDHLTGKSMQDLSGGELQATAIATVLAMEPKVLMFDEVISALDLGGQKRIKDTIRSFKDEERTMIIVDSDVRWLADTVDRILVLDNGQLVYDGPSEDIFTNSEVAKAAGVEKERKDLRLREPAEGKPLVSLEKVSFSYNGTPALKEISLDIKQGSCTAFFGHNGSGKSTLAKVISGLLSPQKGSARINGSEPHRLSANELVKQVAYVYQTPSEMFVADTVENELAINNGNRHKPERLTEFQLQGLENQSPYCLSAGQQQRLAIGCTLNSDPEVVIFDEPTLGQTRENRERLVEQIKELQAKGKTVILISHDIDLVAKAAEDVHVLNSGRLVRSGPARDILQDREFFNNLGLPLPW